MRTGGAQAFTTFWLVERFGGFGSGVLRISGVRTHPGSGAHLVLLENLVKYEFVDKPTDGLHLSIHGDIRSGACTKGMAINNIFNCRHLTARGDYAPYGFLLVSISRMRASFSSSCNGE